MGFFSRKSKQPGPAMEHRTIPPAETVSEEQQRMNRQMMEEQLAADREKRAGRTE